MSQSTFRYLWLMAKRKSRSVICCCFSVESRSFLEATSIVLSNRDLISSLMRILKIWDSVPTRCLVLTTASFRLSTSQTSPHTLG